MSYYRHHVLMCTMEVDDPRCCGRRGSLDLFRHLRACLKQAGLKRVASTCTGCMGRCRGGPCLVIYPEAVWYTPRNEADIEAIVTIHLEQGRRVDHLLMPDVLGSAGHTPTQSRRVLLP